MKKLLLIIFLFLFLSNTSVFCEWRLVDYNQEVNGGNSIDCADKLNCMVISNNGTGGESWVRKTTDGGLTWNICFADTAYPDWWDPYQFKGMSFLNYITPTFAITANSYGELTMTTDGGYSWYAIQLESEISQWSGLSFIDSLNGAVSAWGHLFITNDGGSTWRDTNFNDLQINLIQMLDERTIYGSQYGKFIKTTNGGITWAFIEMPYYQEDMAYSQQMCLFFINSNMGWIAARRQISGNPPIYTQVILHTSDAGETWAIQLDTSESNGHLTGIYFADENEGIAWGEGGQIWRTSDGGINWIRGPEALKGSQKPNELKIFSDHFSGMAFPEGHTRKILTSDYMVGEIWMYDEGVSVREYPTRNSNIALYPNPTRDILHIRTDEIISRVELSDVLGNVVKVQTSESQTSDVYKTSDVLELNVENLPAGMYFLKLYTMSGEVLVEKVIVGF